MSTPRTYVPSTTRFVAVLTEEVPGAGRSLRDTKPSQHPTSNTHPATPTDRSIGPCKVHRARGQHAWGTDLPPAARLRTAQGTAGNSFASMTDLWRAFSMLRGVSTC